MLAGGGVRTAASFREIQFNPHRRPHICGGCPDCCAGWAPCQHSGHPGRSPRGEWEHRGRGRCREAEGLPLGEEKGIRKREEKQQIHLPFAALEDSWCHQRLWGLANSWHFHLMKQRLAAAAHGSTDTASDGTSQASQLLSGSMKQTALPWANLSTEGPGSTSRLHLSLPRSLGHSISIVQLQGPQRKRTS